MRALLVLLWLFPVPLAHAEAELTCPAHCRPEDEPPKTTVDLNHADEAALESLPGIGPSRAQAILAFRQSHGAFVSLSQLLHIKGIGRSLLKQLRPLVTL